MAEPTDDEIRAAAGYVLRIREPRYVQHYADAKSAIVEEILGSTGPEVGTTLRSDEVEVTR